MTTITTTEKQNFDHLKNLPDTIYLGVQPVRLKEMIMVINHQFYAALFMRPGAIYEEINAIGIWDSENKEHLIAFSNIRSLRACLKFLYASSTKISRQWYQLLGHTTSADQMLNLSYEYLTHLPGFIFMGTKNPKENKVGCFNLTKDHSFEPKQFFAANTSNIKQRAIGLLDIRNQEQIFVIKSIEGMRSCLKYLYSSSHVIPRSWYLI